MAHENFELSCEDLLAPDERTTKTLNSRVEKSMTRYCLQLWILPPSPDIIKKKVRADSDILACITLKERSYEAGPELRIFLYLQIPNVIAVGTVPTNKSNIQKKTYLRYVYEKYNPIRACFTLPKWNSRRWILAVSCLCSTYVRCK